MATNDLDRVIPLNRLDDFEVADGNPDVRGWKVMSADGQEIGRVDQLLVDTDAMKVRYLDVDMKRGMGGAEDRHTLLPIGYAVLDRHTQTVKATNLRAEECPTIPAYGRAALTQQGAQELDDHWRARGGDNETRMTLSEEQLAVRKRERAAGEVEIEKHVVTEHVRQAVPLTHDEVVVERHAIEGGTAAGGAIGGNEHISVPITSEEAVVEKRVVPKEELVVRKQSVTENEIVEADLRSEHAEVTRDGTAGPNR